MLFRRGDDGLGLVIRGAEESLSCLEEGLEGRGVVSFGRFLLGVVGSG